MKNKNLLVGGIVGLGIYGLLRQSSPKPVTGLGASPTGLISQVAPDEVVGTIRRVSNDLFGPISQAVSLTGTPPWLIQAISAHEIRYKPYTFINPAVHATGPMQMTPPTMFDTYYFALKMGLVTAPLQAYMQKTLGAKYDQFVKLAKNRQSDNSFSKFLLNPAFNVLMGALLIRCLMQMFTVKGQLDEARLALGYNRGIGYSDKKLRNLPPFDAIRLMASAPGAEARAYIRDMVGSGGFFDQVRAGTA